MNSRIDRPRLMRHIKRVLVGALLVFLVLGWLNSKTTLDLLRANRPYIYEAGYSLPGAGLVQAATLNFRTAAADMVWISAVQFVAKSMIARQKADAVTDYADTVVALDPYFYKIYSWHSAARMLAVGYPSPDDIEAANDLLEAGMYWFPDNWRLPYEAVANYIGFNMGVEPETRKKQLQRGIEFAEKAAAMPGSPEMMASLALRFRQQLKWLEQDEMGEQQESEDSREFDKAMLIHLYSLTTSEQARESILNRLSHLDGADDLIAQLQAHSLAQRRWHEDSSLNYLPFDLFLTSAGPPPAQNPALY